MKKKVNRLINKLLELQVEICENDASYDYLAGIGEDLEAYEASKRNVEVYKKLTAVRKELVKKCKGDKNESGKL